MDVIVAVEAAVLVVAWVRPGKTVAVGVLAGGVEASPQAAKKRPPTNAPNPAAVRRRNSLRVIEAITFS